jgi:arylsulfatase A-like enzyme
MRFVGILSIRLVPMVAAAVVVLAIGPAAVQAADKRPNVLFIAVDDMRCELGCYGAAHVRTPKMDQLASSGVLFTRAYCQQAVCNPSRVSLLTGLRPDSTKVWDLVTEMRSVMPDAVTLPQHFRQHGYRAVAYGKIFHNPFPDAASWDEPTHNAEDVIGYSEANRAKLAQFRAKMKAAGKNNAAITRMRGPATEIQEQPDDKNFDGKQTSDALLKMRELAASDAPFFLAVGFIRPHLPFITPKKYWDLYDRAKLPLAANGYLPKGAPAVAFGDRSLGGFYELRGYLDYADAPSPFERPLTEDQQRELKHGYYASVSFIDAQVGRLLAGLDELGLAKNTIVVLWSDHGWKLGEHNGWCKQTVYEIDTRVPLMIRAPEAAANGQKCRALVEFVDIYPTLCDLAGLPAPKSLAGKSLAPLLADASASVKDAAFSQFPRTHEGREHMGYAMRTDRYRYVEWLDAVSGDVVARELYDHADDPDENQNVADRPEHATVLARLNEQMWKALPRPAFPHPVVRTPASANRSGDQPKLTWHASAVQAAKELRLPASKPAGEFHAVTFVNNRPDAVQLLWIGPDGSQKHFRTLENKDSFRIRTRPGAVWLISTTAGTQLGYFQVENKPGKTATGVIPAP